MKYAELTEKKGIIRFKGGWVMPQMPEPVDLRKSRQSNQSKSLTGAVMSELEALNLGDRANVMMYSLTESQHEQVDKYFDWKDEFEKRIAGPEATYEKFISTARYDLEKSTLSYKGKSASFAKSPIARSLLEILFGSHDARNNHFRIMDFLDEFKEELNELDILSSAQLRQAKRNINAKFDPYKIFPIAGTMEIVDAIG